MTKQRHVLYGITKTVKISAGHFLRDVGPDHPCAKQHGHNYNIQIHLEAYKLDDTGFIIDFNVLKELIKSRLDHVNLNEVMKLNPTAENIAFTISQMILDYLFQAEADQEVFLRRVDVQETDTGGAYVIVKDGEAP